MKAQSSMVLVALFLSLIVLSGCATKSSQARVGSSPMAMDNHKKQAFLAGKESAAKAQSEEAAENTNPILTQEEYEAQQRGEVPQYDIEVVRNDKVEMWLKYFQGKGRKWFHLWLERSGRYVPFMRKILRDHDLPEDLVNLAMIESGFSTTAYSRARAVGPWQFMKATGKLYGLQVDFWVDERRDPEKSSVAAARHLKDLYDQFQSWKLAAAAYNAGAGKVSRAIQRYRTEDFWELTKGRYLRAETRNYVPKIIAAALIAKEPEKYGFTDIQFQDPLQYDKIVLESPMNLVVLAERSGVELESILSLNPELNHPVTPPVSDAYELRVPLGTSQKFMETMASMSGEEKLPYSVHRVRKGDTYARLAQMYGIKEGDLLRANGTRKWRKLSRGEEVLIPIKSVEKLASVKDWYKEPVRRRKRSSNRSTAFMKKTHAVTPAQSVYAKSRANRAAAKPAGIIKTEQRRRVDSSAL